MKPLQIRSLTGGVAILLALAITAAFVFNRFSPAGIPLMGAWEEGPVVGARPEALKQTGTDSTVITDTGTVTVIIKDKRRVLIDVRPKAAFDQGHLPGAVNYPLHHFDQNLERLMTAFTPSTPLLVYCESATCMESQTFARNLKMLGFSDVKIFSGGFRLWKEEGHPIELP